MMPSLSSSLFEEGKALLLELQAILNHLGKDDRRRAPQFLHILARYKTLGARLHEARKQVSPVTVPIRSSQASPQSLSPAETPSRSPLAPPSLLRPRSVTTALGTAPPVKPGVSPPGSLRQALPRFISTLGPAGSRAINRGPEVLRLQKLLRHLDYDVLLSGAFDVKTFRAVNEFQKAHKLEVNGLVGEETRKILNEMVTG